MNIFLYTTSIIPYRLFVNKRKEYYSLHIGYKKSTFHVILNLHQPFIYKIIILLILCSKSFCKTFSKSFKVTQNLSSRSCTKLFLSCSAQNLSVRHFQNHFSSSSTKLINVINNIILGSYTDHSSRSCTKFINNIFLGSCTTHSSRSQTKSSYMVMNVQNHSRSHIKSFFKDIDQSILQGHVQK